MTIPKPVTTPIEQLPRERLSPQGYETPAVVASNRATNIACCFMNGQVLAADGKTIAELMTLLEKTALIIDTSLAAQTYTAPTLTESDVDNLAKQRGES